MSLSTVYVVVYAERFSAHTEGIFSTREKAEAFLVKRVKLDDDLHTAENYEIREEVVDELDEAFVQHSVIATFSRETNEMLVVPLGEGELVAELAEPEFLTYTSGERAIIAYGRDHDQAVKMLHLALDLVGEDYFQPEAQHAE